MSDDTGLDKAQKFSLTVDSPEDPKFATFNIPIERIIKSETEGLVMMLGYFRLYEEQVRDLIFHTLKKRQGEKKIITPEILTP